jgi:hypothetical protein
MAQLFDGNDLDPTNVPVDRGATIPKPNEEVRRRYDARMLIVARRMLRNDEDAHDAVREALRIRLRVARELPGNATLSTWLCGERQYKAERPTSGILSTRRAKTQLEFPAPGTTASATMPPPSQSTSTAA